MDGLGSSGAGGFVIRSMEHKSLLITGSTGFLAKVFMEEVLRVQPQVKKLYLLLRAQDNTSAAQRFQQDVIGKEVFSVLREKHGEGFNSFMSTKVVPFAGDISLENLGIKDSVLEEEMFKETDFIVNVAATTNFDERYDLALSINTFGVKHVCEFARKCQKLELFLHVSTAYSTREKAGLIFETPLRMDETFNKSWMPLNIEVELKIVEERLKQLREEKKTEKDTRVFMKELGLQRARMHGWPNTYMFTKAMGEMVLGQLREISNVPMVIVRPPIITSTYKQPFPGWIEGFKTIDAMVHNYGKGKLSHFVADPDSIMDVIPGDMVVNVMIVAIAVHRLLQPRCPDLVIYHVGSSKRNPLKFSDLADLAFEYFSKNPNLDDKKKPIKVSRMTILPTVASLSKCIKLRYQLPLQALRVVNILCFKSFENRYNKFNRKYKRLIRFIELYLPFVLFKGIFDVSNLEKLGVAMKEEDEDRKDFDFNPKCIDWKDYFMNIHFPGCTKHLFL